MQHIIKRHPRKAQEINSELLAISHMKSLWTSENIIRQLNDNKLTIFYVLSTPVGK